MIVKEWLAGSTWILAWNVYYCFEHIIGKKIVAMFMYGASVVLVWLS